MQIKSIQGLDGDHVLKIFLCNEEKYATHVKAGNQNIKTVLTTS